MMLPGGTIADTTGLTVDDASKFQDGHIILVESEKMVVKSANTTADTLEVYARGFGDTSAAAHADDTADLHCGHGPPGRG